MPLGLYASGDVALDSKACTRTPTLREPRSPSPFTDWGRGEVLVDDPERGILGAEAHKCNVRSKFR